MLMTLMKNLKELYDTPYNIKDKKKHTIIYYNTCLKDFKNYFFHRILICLLRRKVIWTHNPHTLSFHFNGVR